MASTRVNENGIVRIESQSQTLEMITMKISVLAKKMAVGVEI